MNTLKFNTITDFQINKYLDYLKKYNHIDYYGEFTIESREPYEYKWILSTL